ncbi:MAG: ribonuclease III [Candidatus Aminicenantes bacterium]|nr:MAG: ribonuclease III [Candidatus Aminicenantes bacterium]
MLEELEKTLNYTFKNKEILHNALIHKSFHEGLKKGLPDNEKLEFLGDSVINLVITDYLFVNFDHLNEGELSKLKAHLVSTNSLSKIAQSMNLGDFAFIGKGEEKNDGRSNKKINASLLEAVVGAIYIDSSYKTVSSLVISFFKEFLDKIADKEIKINDYKSELQELIQKKNNYLPVYKIIEESGKPPHVVFTAAVYIENNEIGRGSGTNKRKAEQDAALNALKKVDDFINYEKLSEVFFLKND